MTAPQPDTAAVRVQDARDQAVEVLARALDDAAQDLAAARFGDLSVVGSSRAAAQLAVDELLECEGVLADLAGLARPAMPVTTARHVVVPREVLARWARELASLEQLVADRPVGLLLRAVAGRVAVYALRREGS